MRTRSTLLTTAAFALIGPGIAALGLVIYTNFVAFSEGHKFAAEDAFVWPVFVWAYALGFIPAAVTGLVWALIARRISTTRSLGPQLRLLLGAILGALVSAALGAALLFEHLQSLFFAQFPLWGGTVGAILAVIFPPKHWLAAPSNNRWRGP